MKKKSNIIRKIFKAVVELSAFLGMSIINLPYMLFKVTVIVIVIYILIQIKIYCSLSKEEKIKQKYLKENKQQCFDFLKLLNEEHRSKIIAQMLQDDLNQKHKIEKYHKKQKRIKRKMGIAIGVFICICFFNIQSTIVFARSVAKFVTNEITSTPTPTPEVTPTPTPSTPTPTPEVMPTPTPEVTPTPTPSTPTPTPEVMPTPTPEVTQENNKNTTTWVWLVLVYPNGYPDINDDELNKLYNEIFYIDEESLDERIFAVINILINSCKDNTSLVGAVTSSGRSTKYYSDIEKEFYDNNGKMLSSNLWDEIIDGRKELFELYPNGKLAWLLANHYQTYALNYLNQTDDEISVLYLYMESIYYVQKSLEFDMSIEDKYVRLQYLQARYKDIAECKAINSNIRLRAYEIYSLIQETINELQIEH